MTNPQTSAAGESGIHIEPIKNYFISHDEAKQRVRVSSKSKSSIESYFPEFTDGFFDKYTGIYSAEGFVELDPDRIAKAKSNFLSLEILDDTNSSLMNSEIKYSVGTDTYDNVPVQLVVKDFNAFAKDVFARCGHKKGEIYFCGPLSLGPHDTPAKFRDEKHYRLMSHAEPRKFLPLDFDWFASEDAFNKTWLFLNRYSCFAYTTASHKPLAPRARAVFELNREVSRSEGVLVGAAFQSQLEEVLGANEFMLDPSVYKAEQQCYGPIVGASTFFFDGELLDVDELLVNFPQAEVGPKVSDHNSDNLTNSLSSDEFPYTIESIARIKLGLARRTNATGWNNRDKWLNTMFSMRTLVVDANWPNNEVYELFDEWAHSVDEGEGLYDEVANLKKWNEPDKGSGIRLTYKSLLEKADTTVEQLPINSSTGKFNIYDFALNGSSGEMEKQMLEDEFILGKIALLGNSTAIYAAPNGGKTLLTLSMLIKSVNDGLITARDIFYINADDAHKGMLQKLQLAEKHGFMALAPDYKGFKSHLLPQYLTQLIEQNEARGKIFILDTVKKFTDIMSKDKATEFGKTIRSFVSHGGSVIMLAHVNKHRDSAGKSVYSGTTDIIDDCDAAYTIDTTSVNGISTAIYNRIKCRGDNVSEAAYTFNSADGVQYLDRLGSVCEVSSTESKKIAREVKLKEKYENEIAFIEKQLLEGAKSQGTLLQIHKAHKSTGSGLATTPKVLVACLKDLTSIIWQVRSGTGNEKIYYL